MSLSLKDTGYNRSIHFLMLAAHSNPEIKNKNLLNNINNFCLAILNEKASSHFQLMCLYKAIKKLRNFRQTKTL